MRRSRGRFNNANRHAYYAAWMLGPVPLPHRFRVLEEEVEDEDDAEEAEPSENWKEMRRRLDMPVSEALDYDMVRALALEPPTVVPESFSCPASEPVWDVENAIWSIDYPIPPGMDTVLAAFGTGTLLRVTAYYRIPAQHTHGLRHAPVECELIGPREDGSNHVTELIFAGPTPGEWVDVTTAKIILEIPVERATQIRVRVSEPRADDEPDELEFIALDDESDTGPRKPNMLDLPVLFRIEVMPAWRTLLTPVWQTSILHRVARDLPALVAFLDDLGRLADRSWRANVPSKPTPMGDLLTGIGMLAIKDVGNLPDVDASVLSQLAKVATQLQEIRTDAARLDQYPTRYRAVAERAGEDSGFVAMLDMLRLSPVTDNNDSPLALLDPAGAMYVTLEEAELIVAHREKQRAVMLAGMLEAHAKRFEQTREGLQQAANVMRRISVK